MTKLKDFETLELAQAYEEPKTRLISPDMMTSILVATKTLNYFKASAGEVQGGVILAITAGSEFNFIVGHPIGDSHLEALDAIIDELPALTVLKATVIGYCNSTTKPYANTTLNEFNAAKLKGIQDVEAVTYLGGIDYHNKIQGESIMLIAKIVKALDVDTVVTVGLKLQGKTGDYAEIANWKVSWKIPAGKHSMGYEISDTRRLTKKVQFTGTSDILNPFTLEVTGA